MMAAPKRNVQASRPPSLRATPFTFSGVTAFDVGASGEGCVSLSAYSCVSEGTMIDMGLGAWMSGLVVVRVLQCTVYIYQIE
jgi:hypothetical protein